MQEVLKGIDTLNLIVKFLSYFHHKNDGIERNHCHYEKLKWRRNDQLPDTILD